MTGPGAPFPRLYPIVDADVSARCGWTVPALARAFLRGGARVLQVRAKRADGGAFLAICREVVSDAHAAGARVIVNDRVDVAVLAGADGVHVGQGDLPVAEVRRAFPGLPLVGLSTYTPEELERAVASDAAYVAVGPVYDTATKDTGYGAVGLTLVARARQALDLADGACPRPLVAIGGITLDRAFGVIAAGASSVAVISDLLSTGDPEARVREYIARIG
jgi:thiamine-phosphate pyrophosphorylase